MNTEDSNTELHPLVSTGIIGLDKILSGGLPKNHVYLIEGIPGTGKTTLAMQFALEGARQGERVLYITLSEMRQDLKLSAKNHGWDLNQIEIMELLLDMNMSSQEVSSMMFHPSEIELSETMKKIVDAVERIKPSRLVLDALTEIRLQAQTPLRYRREILSLRQFLGQQQCTTLLLDELQEELTAQSVVHGIIEMQRYTSDFGPAQRRIQVAKLRGMHFHEGFHDYIIRKGGLQVFPQLRAAEFRKGIDLPVFPSGLPKFDELLGGGLTLGSSTLLLGPAGSGKSSVATQFVVTAVKNNKRAALFTFDETKSSYTTRAAGMGMDIQTYIDEGSVILQQVDPGEFSPGHFAHIVRHAVEEFGAEVLVIDSLNGYLYSMPNKRFLFVQLHELATYLNQKQILSFFIMSQSGLVGTVESPIETSYLTDNVILFRLFEVNGDVRHAISVVKKRSGSHERTIREMKLTSNGIYIGEPLRNFHGVLAGIPQYQGHEKDLIDQGS